jgi:hypothetical protein
MTIATEDFDIGFMRERIPKGTAAPLTFAFCGDWHRDLFFAIRVIRELASQGITVIYQLGDFGLFPGELGKKYLDGVARICNELGVRLVVIPGNHDDYDRIATMRPDDEGWLKLSNPIYCNIFFAPRGHTWMESGYRFAALGGAGSVDRLLREEGTSWWAAEQITDGDCLALVHNVQARGWDRVDFLLTHEAPAGPHLISMFNGYNRPAWFTVEIEYDCWTQRIRMRNAVDQIMPYINIHGHWHNRSRNLIDGVSPLNEEYQCTVLGLNREGSRENFWRPSVEEIASFSTGRS